MFLLRKMCNTCKSKRESIQRKHRGNRLPTALTATVVVDNRFLFDSHNEHVPISSYLRRSGALVLTDLGIDDGSFAWKLCMDILCLSFDGNLADAALIAAMGSLMRLKLPGTRRIGDEVFVTKGKQRGWQQCFYVCSLQLLCTYRARIELLRFLSNGSCCNSRQVTTEYVLSRLGGTNGEMEQSLFPRCEV